MSNKIGLIIGFVFIFVMFIGFTYAFSFNIWQTNKVTKGLTNISSFKLQPTFNISSRNITFKENTYSSVFPINLERYINNPNDLNYTLRITKTMQNVYCSISVNKKLNCIVKKDYFGKGTIELLIKESGSRLVFNINITPTINELSYNYQFPNGEFLLAVTKDMPTTLDLSGLFDDLDKQYDQQNYTYEFIQQPKLANCNIVNNILSCTSITQGSENITIKVIDGLYSLNLHMQLIVLN